jgi:acyl carrier protein phosphodiesterase
VNYLAHAYLSFGSPEIAVGNMISDFIKGKKKLDYPLSIRRGIALHRAIDTFTDFHETTRTAKAFFRSNYRLYAGALVDVAYDHFLATDPLAWGAPDAGENETANRLKDFSQRTYKQLEGWQTVFPERFARMFPYMRTQDWLYNYRYREGIFNSFAGLVRRAAYMPDAAAACRIFEENYNELSACYREFFPALRAFAFTTLEELERGDGVPSDGVPSDGSPGDGVPSDGAPGDDGNAPNEAARH